MPSMLNFPAHDPPDQSAIDFAAKLKNATQACRIHHEKMGVKKALNATQLMQAAATFDAASSALVAAKKLLDTSHPKFRAVVKIRGAATKFWKSITAPFPDPGVRLIRRDKVAMFDSQMTEFRAQLYQAVSELQAEYTQLKRDAQVRLGELYNSGDYPENITAEFDLEWDYPNVDPPAYLKQSHPELYEAECKRIQARFDEALAMTEQAFVNQFHELVAHLCERLKGEADGKPKVFRDSAVENLNAFFGAFREMNIGSNTQLEQLVTHAQNAVKGITPDDLRGSIDTRASVANNLGEIQKQLDELMINKPNRAFFLEEDDAGQESKGAAA